MSRPRISPYLGSADTLRLTTLFTTTIEPECYYMILSRLGISASFGAMGVNGSIGRGVGCTRGRQNAPRPFAPSLTADGVLVVRWYPIIGRLYRDPHYRFTWVAQYTCLPALSHITASILTQIQVRTLTSVVVSQLTVPAGWSCHNSTQHIYRRWNLA